MNTTFPHFPNLAAEIRCKIWEHALESHTDHVIANAPTQISNQTDRNGNPVPLDDGESVLVVDCFAIPAACREARDVHLSRLRQLRRASRRCFKYVSEWWYDPLGAGPRAILLRGEGGDDDDCSEVVISGGRFRSAEHLVAVVAMLFGNNPERITLDFEIRREVSERVCVSRWVYWPRASFWDFDADAGTSGSDSGGSSGNILQDVFDPVWKKIEEELLIASEIADDFPEDDERVTELIPSGANHVVALYPDLSMRCSYAISGIDHFTAVHLFRMRDLFHAASGALPRLSRLEVGFEFCIWFAPDDFGGETWDGPDLYQAEWLRLGCVRKGDLYCCWMHEWPSWTFNWR
ncbi:hypothetical protein MCOR25_001276 [Pyricularia grisea]|uniref:2EXR domain-containing protein n=1 Tax=Pyricularia grisea TaxID=148305 RepID=A0A6P8BGJ1_PYRGI|nr:uncharacterized protein PgNI_00719 [Pyricularia grisea]KAI6381345.1 hypothetical protein MCOR25_001276 [Pyricularia grisea]TLD15898.1 hypothetical protein PgNI_00719 [Pyricularia grisea]